MLRPLHHFSPPRQPKLLFVDKSLSSLYLTTSSGRGRTADKWIMIPFENHLGGV